MEPNVAIIILNWNGWEDTIECLESLYRICYDSYEVVVVDNGSENESVERIKEYCQGLRVPDTARVKYDLSNKPISILEYSRDVTETGGLPEKEKKFLTQRPNRRLKLILNERNFGFAEGCNIGIRYVLSSSKPDYILLLNNDTIVEESFLRELVAFSQQDESVGFAGPKTYYYESGGRKDVINSAGCNMNVQRVKVTPIGANEIDVGQYESVCVVDHISGSCILVKTKVIEAIGFLDTRFQTYWEEVDWCRRGRCMGYVSAYVPKARIWHKVSSSDISGRKVYYISRNRILFARKHLTKMGMARFTASLVLYDLWRKCFSLLLRNHDPRLLVQLARGVIDGFSIGK